MKKLLAFLLALTLMVALCACGGDTPDTGDDNRNTTTTTAAAEGEGTTTTGAGDPTDGTTTAADPTDTTAAPTDGTTTATKAPTKTPTATNVGTSDEGTAIRILAIGDDMAVDAMEKHLYDMLKGGYDKVHLGILYAADSTIDTHYAAIQNDTKSYEFRQNSSGKWTKESKVAPSKAFKAADWDYVVIQQEGNASGQTKTYANLKNMTARIAKQCGDASIYWHMTWAYQQDKSANLLADYSYSQQQMYQAIIKATLQQVMTDENVWALIPSGTAIQNLRTSSLKDTLTTDGAHLTDTYGDYTAALTWYCALTGESADTVTYRPAAVKDHLDEIIEAVGNAMNMPSEITHAANGDGEFQSIKILAVGNSFSIDAMHNHLYGVLEGAGYDEIRLGILYVGGCSLDKHYTYLSADSASYEYLENIGGKWTNTKEYKASTAFALTDWDYVVFQQVSGQSGRPESYGKLDALIDLIRPQIGKAKLYWQMTWAYQQDSDHSDFGKYNKDQMTMYNAIVSTVKEKIVNHPKIDGVIPSGTAIQNLRTSSLGDTLTADGYHLENAYGDYTASLTWYCTITGESAYGMYYCPSSVGDHFHEIAEAVDNAVEKPFEVTESAYPAAP